MRRFQAHQFNAERAEQSRWIWTRMTLSTSAFVLAAVAFVLRPDLYLLYAPAFAGGVIGFIGAVLMIARLPEPEPLQDESWRLYEQTRPMMQAARTIRPVNWRAVISPEKWAAVRFYVRRNSYYISRDSVGYPAGLTSEEYRDLRAELIRCGVLEGNDIPDAARHVFAQSGDG